MLQFASFNLLCDTPIGGLIKCCTPSIRPSRPTNFLEMEFYWKDIEITLHKSNYGIKFEV